jgi:hypothetical protein
VDTTDIPADLIEQLKVRKETYTGRLVLGTSTDTPNWKWLPLLKHLSRHVALNCERCRGCRDHEECGHWRLHKIRAGKLPISCVQESAGAPLWTTPDTPAWQPCSGTWLPLRKDTQAKINSIAWFC